MGNKHRKHSIFTIHRKFKLGGVIVKLHGVGGVGWSSVGGDGEGAGEEELAGVIALQMGRGGGEGKDGRERAEAGGECGSEGDAAGESSESRLPCARGGEARVLPGQAGDDGDGMGREAANAAHSSHVPQHTCGFGAGGSGERRKPRKRGWLACEVELGMRSPPRPMRGVSDVCMLGSCDFFVVAHWC